MPETGRPNRWRLAELLGGLSLACDLADGFAPGTVLRAALLAVELARRSGLSARDQYDSYYVTLLRYLGCTAFSHEESHRYGAGDDIALRRTMALADAADPAFTLQRVLRGVAPGRPLADKTAAIARLLGDGRAVNEHARAQCDITVRMAELVRLGPRVCGAMRQVCERWDGKGAPAHARADEIDVVMRVHHLADAAAVACQERGSIGALQLIQKRAAGQFDPDLTRVFVAHAPELFAQLEAADLWQRFLDAEPEPRAYSDRADSALQAFAHFADLKSVYTLGHSTRTAQLVERAAQCAGLSSADAELARQAALVHDIGRVAVSNAIWDKPAALSVAEFESVRLHAYYTERVLLRAPALHGLAQLAAASHERCDGSGYHRGLPASLVPLAGRLLAAADAYSAMREPRPQRAALSEQRAQQELLGAAQARQLDAVAVRAVLEAASGEQQPMLRAWPNGLSEREVEVLRLVARGHSNKEVARELSISAKTVQHHVAHVYDKIGVNSRAAAAMFASEHGLLSP